MIEKMKLFEDKSDKLKNIEKFVYYIIKNNKDKITQFIKTDLKARDVLKFKYPINMIKDDKFNTNGFGEEFEIWFVFNPNKGTKNGQLFLKEKTIVIYVDEKIVNYGSYVLYYFQRILVHEMIHLYQLKDSNLKRSGHIKHLERELKTIGLSDKEIKRCEYLYRPFEIEAYLNEYINDEGKNFISNCEYGDYYNQVMSQQNIGSLVEIFADNEDEFEYYLYLYDDRIKDTKVITYIRKKFERIFLTTLNKSFNTKEITDFVKTQNYKNGFLYRMIMGSLLESFINSIIS